MKIETLSITCDTCTKDILYTNYSSDSIIVVTTRCKNHNPRSSTVFAMELPPPLDHDYHFCGKPCLKVWLEKL